MVWIRARKGKIKNYFQIINSKITNPILQCKIAIEVVIYAGKKYVQSNFQFESRKILNSDPI